MLIDTKDSFTTPKSSLNSVSSSLIPLMSSLSSESPEQADCLTKQVLGWFQAEPRVTREQIMSSWRFIVFTVFQSDYISCIEIFQQDSQLSYILSCVFGCYVIGHELAEWCHL